MREPPLGLEEVPDPNLEIFFDEILAAPTTEELLVGLYEKAIPGARRARLSGTCSDTNPLTDAPSVRVCRFALLEARRHDRVRRRRRCRLVDAAEVRANGWLSLNALTTPRAALDGASDRSRHRSDRSGTIRPSPTSTTPSPSATSGSPTCGTRGQRRGVPLRPGRCRRTPRR